MANIPSDTAGDIPAPSFWRDPEKRALVYQVAVVAVIVWFLYSIINNTATNMESRGLAPALGF